MPVEISAVISRQFFNTDELVKRLGKAKHDRLAKIGAFVRTTAQRSMRPARTANLAEIRADPKAARQYVPAAEGEPPRTRDKKDIRRFLVFALEQDDNVVIGPLATLTHGDNSTPGRLERGGEVTLTRDKVVILSGKRVFLKKGTKVKTKKHPFMQPALEQERAKMPALFADSL